MSTQDRRFEEKGLFLLEQKKGKIEALFKAAHQHELYSERELEAMILSVHALEIQNLPLESLICFESLCGRIHRLKLNQMVDVYFEKALSLSKLTFESDEEHRRSASSLKQKIRELCSNHVLSEENLTYLRMALLIVNRSAPSKQGERVQTPFIKSVSPEFNLRPIQVRDLRVNLDLSIELLQVAQMLYEKNPKGFVDYKLLPPSIQEALGPAQSSPHFIESMVGYGMNLVRQDGYAPSMKEIERIFHDAPKDQVPKVALHKRSL